MHELGAQADTQADTQVEAGAISTLLLAELIRLNSIARLDRLI
jgi:hypothetical protein